MKRKKLLKTGYIIGIFALFSILFGIYQVYEHPELLYERGWMEGKTIDEIESRYGAFDKVYPAQRENGGAIYGYDLKADRTYLEIYFSVDGKAKYIEVRSVN